MQRYFLVFPPFLRLQSYRMLNQFLLLCLFDIRLEQILDVDTGLVEQEDAVGAEFETVPGLYFAILAPGISIRLIPLIAYIPMHRGAAVKTLTIDALFTVMAAQVMQ